MKSSSRAARRFGFNLLEVLALIALSIILMVFLLALIPMGNGNSWRLEAQNTTLQIVTAANAYYTEYGKFPALSDPSAPAADPNLDQWVGDPAMGATLNNNALFYTLRNIAKGPNINHSENPRKVTFIEGKVAVVSGAGVARGGFFDKNASGGTPDPNRESCFYDPWGHQYGIILDTNGDDQIDLKGIYTDFSGAGTTGKAPKKKAGAFSMGKDEKLGKRGDNKYRSDSEKSDDVISWE